MAENKKSFIAYSDWYGMFKALPDDVAGKLIKHIFSYVNDENPKSDDYVINALFEQVKSTLKRDLTKWETQREQRSLAGKKSAEIRSTKTNENQRPFNDRLTNNNEKERNSTVNVNVNDNVSVNDNVNVKENKNILLSEIDISDVPQEHSTYFEIAKSFHELFKTNSNTLNVKWSHLEKTRFDKAITPIRLLIEVDKRSIEEIREVYGLLQKDQFWMQNIQTTESLRKQFDKLITKSRNYGKQQQQQQSTIRTGDDQLADFIRRGLEAERNMQIIREE